MPLRRMRLMQEEKKNCERKTCKFCERAHIQKHINKIYRAYIFSISDSLLSAICALLCVDSMKNSNSRLNVLSCHPLEAETVCCVVLSARVAIQIRRMASMKTLGNIYSRQLHRIKKRFPFGRNCCELR